MFKRTSLFLLLIFPFFLHAQEPQKTSFDALDVFEMQYASGPMISPDGQHIVYTRNQYDLMADKKYTNLWLVNFNGDKHMPLTSGKENYGNAAWSPDGSKIAYTSSEEGSSQLFVRWMESGQTASITNLTKSPGNLSWSPDGEFIAFTLFVPREQPSIGTMPSTPKGAEWAAPAKLIDKMNYRADGNFNFVEPGYSHIYLVSAEGGAPRKITDGDFNHGKPEWHPGGNIIVFSANREDNAEMDSNNTHLFIVDINTLKISKISEGRGPHQNPKISPDGKLVAYTGYEDRFVGYQLSHLYLMDLQSKSKKQLNHSLNTDFDSYYWASDSKSLFAQYTWHGQGKLANISLTGKVSEFAGEVGGTSYGRPYSSGSFSVAENGRYVFTESTPYQPAELAVSQYGTKMAIRKITSLNATFLKQKQLGKVEEIWFNSSYDNKKIQGWIIYPPGFDSEKKYPLILEIHGGPYLSYGPHFTPELQLMATKGYVVLYTNPRGSTSYGEEFAAYINNNYPSEDYDDLMSGIDAVVDRGFIDTERLFITGGSGGGVLTSWSIGKTDRFTAAVVSKPVINWYSFVLTSDGGSVYHKYWFNKKPWDDPAQYLQRSPLSLVGNVKTPAMVIVGEQDYRTPLSESEQYYKALKLQGVESMLVIIPGAGHSITARPSNMLRQVAYITGWFDKYSKK